MSSRKGCMYSDDVKYEGWTVMPPRLADGEGARDMKGISDRGFPQMDAGVESRYIIPQTNHAYHFQVVDPSTATGFTDNPVPTDGVQPQTPCLALCPVFSLQHMTVLRRRTFHGIGLDMQSQLQRSLIFPT